MPDIFDLIEDDEDMDDTELDTNEEDDEDDDTDDEVIPWEFGIDFNTGQLTGTLVSGLEAVKVWVWLALKTARYRFMIYSWEYGSELETLIGTGYSEEFTAARAQKFVEECLYENPYIINITDFSASFEDDVLNLGFSLETDFGEEEIQFNV